MIKIITRLEACIAVTALVTMFICISLQVFCRYVLNNALEWPEEVARYAFICSVFFGAAMAATEGRHLEISVCKFSFGKKVQKILTICSAFFSCVFCAMMVWWGVLMVIFIHSTGQLAESMPFPMWPVYIIIPAGLLCMLVRTIQKTCEDYKRIGKADGKTAEEDKISQLSNSW